MNKTKLKQQAALFAAQIVQNGMHLGLGSGTTASYFIHYLGERWKAGELPGIKCVATSNETARLAKDLGLPLTTLMELRNGHEPPSLDLAVDGADEVDPQLDLIKGLGKAALREKIIEMHARKFIIIVDDSKIVDRLGRGPLPVEIVPFEAQISIDWLASLGCRAELWCDENGVPFMTENNNWIVRCWFPQGITQPKQLAEILERRPGIIGHGLFLGMATEVIVAGEGGIKVLKRN